VETDKIIEELRKERDRLTRAIDALIGAIAPTKERRGGIPKSGARQGGISAAGRKRLSELMKQRWAERKRRGGIRKQRGGIKKRG
jgi:hypothetical protein